MILEKTVSDADFQRQGLDKLAKHARLVLVLIAGINVAAAAFFAIAADGLQWPLLTPLLVSAAIHGGLALWATKMPLPAVAAGFALFGLGIVAGLAQGGSIFDGIMLNVILLALYLNGIQSAVAFNNMKAKLVASGMLSE